MARFDVGFGNWLPDDEEPRVMAECSCCGADLYEGDSVIEFDGEYYCDADCFSSIAERVTLGEDD